MAAAAGAPLAIRPLTAACWPDLVALFGPRGAYGGCWCMYWRLPAAAFARAAGAPARAMLEARATSGPAPGLLAYRDGRAVGWCALGPRADFPRLDRSRQLAPVDDRPVYALPCFFVARSARGTGVGAELVRAAVTQAADRGAAALEAYPVDPRRSRVRGVEAYTGLLTMFQRAAFQVAADRGGRRVVVRRAIGDLS